MREALRVNISIYKSLPEAFLRSRHQHVNVHVAPARRYNMTRRDAPMAVGGISAIENVGVKKLCAPRVRAARRSSTVELSGLRMQMLHS